MKLIADGGAITKNVTPNSRDAIILALNTPYVDGFKLKLYLTKDNRIVTVSEEDYRFFEEQLGGIKNATLTELQGYNLGTHIHRQNILTLQEILNIFRKYKKDLVLQLSNQQQNNALFVDLILVELHAYKDLDIYLESEEEEIISYLQSDSPFFKVGAVVCESSLSNFNLNVDFYDICIVLLGQLNIREKVNQGKFIMINQINRRDTFDMVYEEYQDIFNFIFIITNFISILNNDQNFMAQRKF